LVNSLIKEIHLRKNYLPEKTINSIYFGGGTPSLLRAKDFERIFEAINQNYTIDSAAEITFEANPDDLTAEYFAKLSPLPFNRISIGIQSFNDYYLGLLNRRHSPKQALLSIKNAKKAGFKNISIDLIYGLPYQTLNDWEKELNTALQADIQHISAYGLTYEKETMLWKMLNDERIEPVSDETMNKMYRMLLKKTRESGFEAYEISNFALSGFRSRHNSAYWKQVLYIGFGVSAHSYNGESRQWNCSSIDEYIQAISENKIPAEEEKLSHYDRYNDFIMTSLRTAEGINLNELEAQFGTELKKYCLENIKNFIKADKIEFSDNTIRLNTDGVLISNSILAEMMKV
jgi:oxygen-independent coproporphyrinogen-3 oxidase